MENKKDSYVVIDGKQYQLVEVVDNQTEERALLNDESHQEWYTEPVEVDTRTKVRYGIAKFISILISTPFLLMEFSLRFFFGVFKMPIAWLCIKGSLLLTMACFFAVFDSGLHWISHEWAIQVNDFMLLHLWGTGPLSNSKTLALFPYIQVEIGIILFLTALMAFVETYEAHEKSKTP